MGARICEYAGMQIYGYWACGFAVHGIQALSTRLLLSHPIQLGKDTCSDFVDIHYC